MSHVNAKKYRDVLKTCNKLEVERDHLKAELDLIKRNMKKTWPEIHLLNESQKDRDLWKSKAEKLAEALRSAIEISEDAVNQHRYPDGKPSYFDEKWGWTDGLYTAKAVLDEFREGK